MSAPRVVLAAEVPEGRLPLPVTELAALLARAVESCGYAGRLSVAVVDDATMRAVNRDYHACDEPTDVLAFALDGPTAAVDAGAADAVAEGFAGEVVVSLDTAEREAAARGVATLSELVLYVVHGTLHLLGFDDHEAAATRRMHGRTLEVLAGLGLENRLDLPDDEDPCADDADV